MDAKSSRPLPQEVARAERRLTDPDQIWERYQESLRPEAQEVLGVIKGGSNVIISGPNKVGKTFNFMPVLKSEASQAGYVVGKEEAGQEGQFKDWNKVFRNHEDMSIVFPTLRTPNPNGENRLLILDEVNSVAKWEKTLPEAADFLRYLKERGVSFALINSASTKDARRRVTELLQGIAPQVPTQFVDHNFRSMYIPTDLVLDYFSLVGAGQEVIDFVANPQNKALLTPGIFWLIDTRRRIAGNKFKSLSDLRLPFLFPGSTGIGAELTRFPGLYEAKYGGTKTDFTILRDNLGLSPRDGFYSFPNQGTPEDYD